jgi:hypothetical protein
MARSRAHPASASMGVGASTPLCAGPPGKLNDNAPSSGKTACYVHKYMVIHLSMLVYHMGKDERSSAGGICHSSRDTASIAKSAFALELKNQSLAAPAFKPWDCLAERRFPAPYCTVLHPRLRRRKAEAGRWRSLRRPENPKSALPCSELTVPAQSFARRAAFAINRRKMWRERNPVPAGASRVASDME